MAPKTHTFTHANITGPSGGVRLMVPPCLILAPCGSENPYFHEHSQNGLSVMGVRPACVLLMPVGLGTLLLPLIFRLLPMSTRS